MEAKEIIGSFTLRDEGDGCFTSKYHHTDECFTEACKKIITEKNNPDVFVGDFRTCWLEEKPNGQPEFKLTIIKNVNTYLLTWNDGSNDLFKGTAMIFEGNLVGAYWNCN